MTKTTITANSNLSVTLKFIESGSDHLVTMEIWAPAPGANGMSYVRYNGDKQLCNGLSGRGETLTYRAGTPLIALVRSQYRAMRAAERRDMARRSHA